MKLQLLAIIPLTAAWAAPSCKTAPSSIPASTWSSLNSSVSGALLSTAEIGVPGGICHPEQPNYNETLCPTLQEAWFHSWIPVTEHPVHNAYQNWNNDSCWPFPEYGLDCTPLKGYPTYVVNATTADQVSAAVNFAREQNVRLIVKASGHDFRGRSVSGNSLSIWVHNILGLEKHDSFQPAGNCSYGQGDTAITWAAGETAYTKFTFAHQNQLILNVGDGPTVSSGYSLGGGHSIISSTHGLSADNILEVNIVTPDGNLVTANNCQNSDLFWAVRGGGGGTFGVVINATERAYPEPPASVVDVYITGAGQSDAGNPTFYQVVAALVGQFPSLGDAGLMAYTLVQPGNATTPSVFKSEFIGVNKTSNEMAALLNPILMQLNATYSGQGVVFEILSANYSTVYDYWSATLDDNGTGTPIGLDMLIGSRLLDKEALTRSNLSQLLETAAGQYSLNMFLVSGPGVHQYPGDFDALNPSWRTSYVHAIVGVEWSPLNQTSEDVAFQQQDVQEAALREMAPNGGSYVNEANPYELNFQETFWGSNYPRLLSIKKSIDPNNVFWCKSCVGSEGIDVVNGQLCYLS